jgi:vancomycin permeability regulator SanA
MKDRKISDVIIATDAYHCQRAMTMANDLGADATCSPVRTGPNTLENSHFRYLVREAGAYLAYITLGRRGIHISDHLKSSGFLPQ